MWTSTALAIVVQMYRMLINQFIPQRDWEGKREKCRRCIKLGHECGPSERAQKRLGKRRSVMNITEDGHRSIRQHDATYMSDYKGSPESCKPALPLGEGESGMVQSVQIPSAEHVDLKYTIDIDRTAAETQARKIIAILADMNATRELLRRCLVTCERVQRWLGESLAQKVALEAYICAIEVDFQFEIQEALNLATDDLGFSKEFILSELLGIIYRYDHPPTSDELGLIGADQKLIQKILYISCKHKGNYSIADFICSRMRGISSHSAIDNYDKASQAVKNVLSGLKSISRQHFQKQVSFPSCHIAYLHGNATTALDLWSATSHDDPLVDMLERNMVHLAVYNLDIQMLGWLLKHEIGIDEVQHADLFGMTPLQIAACQDDLSCFSLLWQHGADKFVQDVRGRSILALAARNGSQKAVTFILQSGLRLPSLIPEPHEALESGHHHIADMIRTQYNQQTSPFDSTIHSEAARLHVEKTDTQIIKKRALNSNLAVMSTMK
ncbi:Ankyrin repeat domain-containing protein 52 [Neophaeococcomyces mojaviensis]|uniref:Ankyrin repeat domain-containing protein 52 n=1 Tax=Neophaeococcomyces mojaviensis TaxID=3383035 RepID=A0ACC2ZXX8_9EURO|nr:Ankyrin repeat domain-containing protein 52 [Knufia sp. JES_112]